MSRSITIISALLACAVQGYDFVRYENAAARALATAEQQYGSAPELPPAIPPGPVPAAAVGHHIGTYRVLSRAYRWQSTATRFDTDGAGALCLSFVSPEGKVVECRFDLSRPVQVYRLAPAHAPITPAEERGVCASPGFESR